MQDNFALRITRRDGRGGSERILKDFCVDLRELHTSLYTFLGYDFNESIERSCVSLQQRTPFTHYSVRSFQQGAKQSYMILEVE